MTGHLDRSTVPRAEPLVPARTAADCVVVHPGVQHSALLAAALERNGRLLHLITGLQIGADPNRFWATMLRSDKAARALERRLVPFLPDERIIRRRWLTQAAERAVARGPLGAALYHRNLRAAGTFTQRAVRRLDQRANYLFLSDGVALEGLRAADQASRPLVKVLDVAHPFVDLATRLVEEDAAELGLSPASYDDWLLQDPGLSERMSAELQLADVVIVASEFTRSSITAQGVDPERIRVVPYGLPEQPRVRSFDTSPSDELRLVFVGALSERKGITMLLRAMRELERRHVPVTLELIGSLVPGFSFDVAGGLSTNVTHRSGLSDDEVARSVAAAHYLVLPSVCEGFGRVLIEALALGTGVVTTERSAGPDLRQRHPDAPIIVQPAAKRTELADLFEELRESVALTGLDREAASRSGRSYTLHAYGQDLSRVTNDLPLRLAT